MRKTDTRDRKGGGEEEAAKRARLGQGGGGLCSSEGAGSGAKAPPRMSPEDMIASLYHSSAATAQQLATLTTLAQATASSISKIVFSIVFSFALRIGFCFAFYIAGSIGTVSPPASKENITPNWGRAGII